MQNHLAQLVQHKMGIYLLVYLTVRASDAFSPPSPSTILIKDKENKVWCSPISEELEIRQGWGLGTAECTTLSTCMCLILKGPFLEVLWKQIPNCMPAFYCSGQIWWPKWVWCAKWSLPSLWILNLCVSRCLVQIQQPFQLDWEKIFFKICVYFGLSTRNSLVLWRKLCLTVPLQQYYY